MRLQICTLACALLAGNASASVLIDFEGIGNGAQVRDYYNGGTDSLGNIGVNYGIRFTGGVVNNGIISGPFSVSFTPPVDILRVNFMAAQTFNDDGTFSPIRALDGPPLDAGFFDYTMNPMCRSLATCPDGFTYIPPDRLFPGRFLLGFQEVVSIGFELSLADNLFFISNALVAPDAPASGEVPEPSSIALLGLGALGLLSACRRKSAINQNA